MKKLYIKPKMADISSMDSQVPWGHIPSRGNNGRGEGSAIIPMTRDEAFKWLMNRMTETSGEPDRLKNVDL